MKRIFIDVDGVLADFTLGMLQSDTESFHDTEIDRRLDRLHSPHKRKLHEMMSFQTQDDMIRAYDSFRFWAGLPRMPKALEILQLLLEWKCGDPESRELVFLTSPPNYDSPTFKPARIFFLRKLWGETLMKFRHEDKRFYGDFGILDGVESHVLDIPMVYFSNTKADFCSCKDDVLIDDYEKNIIAWEAAGGVAMLSPTPWNERNRDDKSLPVLDVLSNFLYHEIK